MIGLAMLLYIYIYWIQYIDVRVWHSPTLVLRQIHWNERESVRFTRMTFWSCLIWLDFTGLNSTSHTHTHFQPIHINFIAFFVNRYITWRLYIRIHETYTQIWTHTDTVTTVARIGYSITLGRHLRKKNQIIGLKNFFGARVCIRRNENKKKTHTERTRSELVGFCIVYVRVLHIHNKCHTNRAKMSD